MLPLSISFNHVAMPPPFRTLLAGCGLYVICYLISQKTLRTSSHDLENMPLGVAHATTYL